MIPDHSLTSLHSKGSIRKDWSLFSSFFQICQAGEFSTVEDP
jgi:hypothetical protein